MLVESNGLYGNAYLGQFRRFSLPGENPWPLACLTDGYTNLWSYTTWHDTATANQNTTSTMLICTGGACPSCAGGVSRRTNELPVGKHGCHQICRPDGVWTTHFVVCPTEA